MGRHPDDVVALIHADGQDGAAVRAGKRAIKEGAKDGGVVLIDGLTFIQDAEFCRRQAHRAEEIGANLARGVSCGVALLPSHRPTRIRAARTDYSIGLDASAVAEIDNVRVERIKRTDDIIELAANAGIGAGHIGRLPDNADELTDLVRDRNVALHACPASGGMIDHEAVDIRRAVCIGRRVCIDVGPAPRRRRYLHVS